MPKVLVYRNIVFIIFSIDKYEKRPHIHAVKKSIYGFEPAKFWLEPQIETIEKGDFSTKEINVVEKLVHRFKIEIKQQLEVFKAGKKVTAIKINK